MNAVRPKDANHDGAKLNSVAGQRCVEVTYDASNVAGYRRFNRHIPAAPFVSIRVVRGSPRKEIGCPHSLKAQIKQNRAALQLARKKLQDTDIRAPFDGFVKERLVSIGQYLIVQTAVVSLVQTDSSRPAPRFRKKAVPSIREGQAVGVTVDAFDITFQGRISSEPRR
jgi:hypothetical protein